MNTVGIRVKPAEFTFAVFDTTNSAVVNVETVKIPKALQVPEALKYVRNTILDILQEYKIEKACVRITESNAQSITIRRIEIEGVIQEAFASSNLSAYFVGQISSISARIGFDREDFKRYVNGELEYGLIENWGNHNEQEREALLSAVGASNA